MNINICQLAQKSLFSIFLKIELFPVNLLYNMYV